MRGDTTLTSGGPWCRTCTLPARVEGEPELGRAVHTGTGEELGPDGHLCAPVTFKTEAMRSAALGRIAAP